MTGGIFDPSVGPLAPLRRRTSGSAGPPLTRVRPQLRRLRHGAARMGRAEVLPAGRAEDLAAARAEGLADARVSRTGFSYRRTDASTGCHGSAGRSQGRLAALVADCHPLTDPMIG